MPLSFDVCRIFTDCVTQLVRQLLAAAIDARRISVKIGGPFS